jgi:hypothetical protein
MNAAEDVVSPSETLQVQNVPRRELTPSPGFLTALAILLCLFHAILAVTATAGKSTTADEIAHVTAGHAYNTRNDYRLQPENGNLPQRLAALPLALAGEPLPTTALASWQESNVWKYGQSFFYKGGLSTDEFLWLGRGMIALTSAATGLLVFFWSRALFGVRGAFVSLALFVFCPTFLAHGALATSDTVMAFFFLASVGAFWRHLEKPGAGGALLSAVTLGLAFVAKFSAVLLPGMFAAIALVWIFGEQQRPHWRRNLGRLFRTTVIHAVAVWAIIWSFYGFRHSAFEVTNSGAGVFNHGWGWLLTDLGGPAKIIWTLNHYHVLPEAWLYGLTFVIQFSHARGAFLNGDYSLTGWVSFFPFTFVAKSTLPFLLLCLALTVAGLRALRSRLRTQTAVAALSWLRPITPLLVLFAVYWAFSLTSHLNIGHRHILPIYPVLFIWAGWFGLFLVRERSLAAAAVLALVAWHGIESFRIRPHYLAYFNGLVGGPENGWRHLVDSSLDWGQDLPTLKDWLDRNNPKNEPVFLSYFGSGDADYEGVRAKHLYFLSSTRPTSDYVQLEPGLYCVSATILVQVYGSPQGVWTNELEGEYQTLRAAEAVLAEYALQPGHRTELEKTYPASRWRQLIDRHETLRLARLCQYLRVRGPDANAGFSILIYRLTADEIQRATGTTAAWRKLIEETATRK